MGISIKASQRGFSLLEMVVAMALGLAVVGAAVQLYTQGVNATWTVSQRAALQQDFRAASNMLTRDLSLAGAGLGNNVQIALPYGASVVPVYGCDQTPKCYLNGTAGIAFPQQSSRPFLYGLIPGSQLGPTLNASQGPTDIVTVVYTDANFYLNCYKATVSSATVVQFQLPTPLPSTCTMPPTMTTPQTLTDPVAGLTPGDVVMFTLTKGSGTSAQTLQVVAEVTAVALASASPPTYNVTFATGDPMKMNQTAATSGNLGQAYNASPLTTGYGNRLQIVTYYIDNTVSPARLMRMVSGHTPVPLVDNIAYLQFNYDLYDASTGTVYTQQATGGVSLSPPLTPNSITKVNVIHMAMDSPVKGASGGYQGLDLQTSVSTRDLTFKNDYPQ